MTVPGMERVHLAGLRIGRCGHGGYECLSFLGGFAGVPANAACYPRVCLIAKRQVTDSGRGREKRSHLAVGRGCHVHGISQTRDIRCGGGRSENVSESWLVRNGCGVGMDPRHAAPGR